MCDAMSEDSTLPTSISTSDASCRRTKGNSIVKVDKESVLFADSDDDDGDGDDRNSRVLTSTTVPRSQQVGRQSSSDDDFQIVTAPTSTGVVRVLHCSRKTLVWYVLIVFLLVPRLSACSEVPLRRGGDNQCG